LVDICLTDYKDEDFLSTLLNFNIKAGLCKVRRTIFLPSAAPKISLIFLKSEHRFETAKPTEQISKLTYKGTAYKLP
jgi:hypothetical protein